MTVPVCVFYISLKGSLDTNKRTASWWEKKA